MAVNAADVLKVHGANTTSLTVEKGEAMAFGFEVTRELKNVTFEFNSVGIRSVGGIAINKNEIGEDSGFSDTIASQDFEDNKKPWSGFKVDRLGPGRYFVVVWVDQGSIVFAGSGSEISKVENGATRLYDFYAERKEQFAPKSDFDPLRRHGLHFTVREAP